MGKCARDWFDENEVIVDPVNQNSDDCVTMVEKTYGTRSSFHVK